MDIVEKNILIANFMNWIWLEGDEYKDYNKHEASKLSYHSRWDALMPVVEKIESLGFIFTISEQYCNIQDSKNNASVTGVMYAPTKKEVVFNACVRFIEVHIAQKEYLKILKDKNLRH